MNKKNILLISIFLLSFNFIFAQKLPKESEKLINSNFKKIEKLKKENYNEDEIAKLYQGIAITYKNNRIIDKSLEYLDISIKTTDNAAILRANSSLIASIYSELTQYQEAQTYNLDALKYAKVAGRSKNIYKAQMQVAETYIIINEYIHAIKYYEAALKNAQNTGTKKEVRTTLGDLSSAYLKANIYDKHNTAKNILLQEAITIDDVNNLLNYGNIKLIDDKNPYDGIVVKMFEDKKFKDSIYNYFDEKQKKAIDSIELIGNEINERLAKAKIELTDKEDLISDLSNVVKLKTKIVKQQKSALIIFSSLFLTIVVLLIIIFIDAKKKRKQNKTLAKQKQEIQIQAVDLDEKNQELQTILEDLQATQHQLIQSEKMASLGKLIASIAHELNTPLGAINSSIATLDVSSETLFDLLPKYMKNASPQEYNLFKQIIEISQKNKEYISSREVRKIKKTIKKDLEQLGIEDGNYIAGILAEIGVHQNLERYLPLFTKNVEITMETIYNLAINNKIRQNIKTAIKKASKIIYALKNYSRTSNTDKKTQADIRKSVDSVLTLYQNQLKQGIVVNKKYSEIPEIMCFPDDLGQVWTNIIHNSIHAMSGKGELSVKVEKLEENIMISFTDSGIGIPESIKNKVFMPFFTTKPEGEGTGLGLDIVKQIIDKHNGQITFESEAGKGTTFIVLLPIK